MQSRHPGHAVIVVEQNPPDATYGGVWCSRPGPSTCSRRARPASGPAIACLELLQVLQEACRGAGVALEFGHRLADLAHFAPPVELLGNRYIWYGTSQPSPALTLTFRQNPHGGFVAHHYPHGDGASTFIVECGAATWARAGFAELSQDASRAYCEALFRDDLGGHPLLANRSLWLRFSVVTTARWVHERVALVGDALRTVHFSIGSGTRTALEDAIALADAFADTADVARALRAFERARRPPGEAFLEVAARSSAWYERFADRLALDPLPFAHSYLMRGGRISDAQLRARSPPLRRRPRRLGPGPRRSAGRRACMSPPSPARGDLRLSGFFGW
jgi:hypothetical protein